MQDYTEQELVRIRNAVVRLYATHGTRAVAIPRVISFTPPSTSGHGRVTMARRGGPLLVSYYVENNALTSSNHSTTWNDAYYDKPIQYAR